MTATVPFSAAAPAASVHAWPPVSLPGTQQRRLRAQSNGQDYLIQIWLPTGEAPAGGWPALYVLDGQALFGTFVDGVRRSSRRPDATGVHPQAIVAVSHAPAEAGAPAPLYAEAQRRLDFSAGPPVDEPAPAPGSVGGAPAFLRFLVDELAPALSAELGLNPERQSLFGHSLAGYFVLQALAERPQAFRHWAAISPSIWWHEAELHQRLLGTLSRGGAAPRLFMAVGEYEGEVPPWQRTQPGYEALVARRSKRQMVRSAQELAAALAPHLRADDFVFRVFPEEDHASILMIAAQRALRFCSV